MRCLRLRVLSTTYDARRSDHHIHPADVQRLVLALEAKGIRPRRVWRTKLRAERRGKPISDDDTIRCHGRAILDPIG